MKFNMGYTVKTTPHFEHEAKRLIKKYVSLKQEIKELSKQLETTPELGTPLGNSVFKIRIAIASKGKGKRGGARVITYVLVDSEKVFLLSIYDKGDTETISDEEIRRLLEVALG
jgi:mRNA-degrading endonuclease RelE of RelBE toxin-antitoxin system